MKVFINIYDISQINILVSLLGLGVYHTGIEIHNGDEILEFCYSGHPYNYSGIFIIKSKSAKGFTFKESLYVGEVEMSSNELDSIVIDLGNNFTGISYNIFKKNCNHFSNEFIKRMFKNEKLLPTYINRASSVAGFFSFLIPTPVLNFFVPNTTISTKNNQ